MPELINDRKIFSLLEVATSIQKTLSARYTSSFWVKAEMNKLNLYQRSGHCYPDLVEKNGSKVIAQLRAVIWKDAYITINNKFLEVIKEPLKDGIKILLLARITFTPFHGLALEIMDIDPGYTLGDLEKEKLETINTLKARGIFSKNKLLKLPLLPQRVAVISVETSKGYADFLNVIEGNPWGYKFSYFLFPSLLQGEKAVDGLIYQLRQIKKVKHHFDVVAIIRGGGGDIGLSCYNNYKLAEEIALFPLPVITGIGHATNETVAEMISFSNAITPTKLADYLIQAFHDFAIPVQKAKETIINQSRRITADERTRLNSEIRYFRSLTDNIVHTNQTNIARVQEKLSDRCSLFFKGSNIALNTLKKEVGNLDPQNVLRRGYSITRLNGKSIKNAASVREGDILESVMMNGRVTSKVLKTVKTNEKGDG